MPSRRITAREAPLGQSLPATAIDPLPKRASDGGPGHAPCEAATPLLRMEQIDEFCRFGRDVGPQLYAARIGNARAGQDPQAETRRGCVAGRLGDPLRDAVAPGATPSKRVR